MLTEEPKSAGKCRSTYGRDRPNFHDLKMIGLGSHLRATIGAITLVQPRILAGGCDLDPDICSSGVPFRGLEGEQLRVHVVRCSARERIDG